MYIIHLLTYQQWWHMEKIFENFTGSVLRLYRLIQRIKSYEMREFGLKSIHVMCVYYLAESVDGLTAGELASLVYEDKAAVSRALTALRDKGFVEYDSTKYNSHIRLTDGGREVAEYIDEKSRRAVSAGSADMTDAERETFYRSLASITDNLKKYCEKLTGGAE